MTIPNKLSTVLNHDHSRNIPEIVITKMIVVCYYLLRLQHYPLIELQLLSHTPLLLLMKE